MARKIDDVARKLEVLYDFLREQKVSIWISLILAYYKFLTDYKFKFYTDSAIIYLQRRNFTKNKTFPTL